MRQENRFHFTIYGDDVINAHPFLQTVRLDVGIVHPTRKSFTGQGRVFETCFWAISKVIPEFVGCTLIAIMSYSNPIS